MAIASNSPGAEQGTVNTGFAEETRSAFGAFPAPLSALREPGLEPGGPVDLAGDQHAVIEQEARLPHLDALKAGACQGLAAGGGQLDRVAAGARGRLDRRTASCSAQRSAGGPCLAR